MAQLHTVPNTNFPNLGYARDARGTFVLECGVLSGDRSLVMGCPILRACRCSQPSHASGCMGGGASPGHQTLPVPGTPQGFLSSLLARSTIFPAGLPGSPIFWLCFPALIPAHTLYLLVSVTVQALFPLPTSLALDASISLSPNSLGPLGPQTADKGTSPTLAS